ncbi:MAG: phosphate ABC transporter substrate-binding protein [Acidobacteriota bacterium]|nr:phosphate-binding protein [Acidobacteriota bacterium]MEE2648721.1 phosphate ABC transporter substrate-binding protein [Acidobacteriota bacterium]
MKKVVLGFLALALIACGGSERVSRTLIQNKGSDTLVNVAQAWAEAYAQINPNVAVAVTGGGSGTGIAALIGGSVDIANSSRSMEEEEFEMANGRGVVPNELIVGYDALAVYIHPDNPIDGFTLGQLADIYGENGTTESWSQLGITVPGCSSDEIVRVSRQNSSGTYVYFQEAILGESDLKLGSRDMAGSSEVVGLVEKTACAIGYSGLAYATEEVKVPCLMTEDGGNCIAPSTASAVDGTYPIARPLFMYTNGQPEGVTKDYIDWILSDEGQCIILNKGYAPVRSLACN